MTQTELCCKELSCWLCLAIIRCLCPGCCGAVVNYRLEIHKTLGNDSDFVELSSCMSTLLRLHSS
jgi:hypothetical protein